jgi:hypothetical protein
MEYIKLNKKPTHQITIETLDTYEVIRADHSIKVEVVEGTYIITVKDWYDQVLKNGFPNHGCVRNTRKLYIPIENTILEVEELCGDEEFGEEDYKPRMKRKLYI